MRRRISLFVLAFLMVVPAVAPVRAAKPVPTDPPVASAEPQATPEPTPEATPEPTPEPTPEATPDPTEPVESAPPEASPEPESSGPPAAEPTPSPEATPAEEGIADAPPAPVDQTPAKGGDDSHGRPDVTGRYIVLLDAGTDTSATVERMGRQKGIKADRTFGKTIRGFSARLDAKQRKALEADPSVVAVVPDEVIQVEGQTTPTGVARIFTKSNTIAKINGVDERVDADVAIVDTGIQPNHPDLNVVGGYNCSTSNRAAWRDVQNHGTHVAGTVAAKDNTIGVVGVAPGARLWAVKILNDDGYGLLSWYVCGLDWILAQRDPADPSRPLIEAANMSVAKSGDDDPDCGASERDVLHLAICRVVKGGVTVVAAAGNDQHERREVGAGRVQRGDHGLGPGRHRRQARRRSAAIAASRGARTTRTTRTRTSATTARTSTSWLPASASGPRSPARPTATCRGPRWRRPAVTGAAALYKASRPKATPAEVREALQYLGNLNWKTYTDPDSYHERLLDVSKLGPLGTFSLGAPTVGVVPETGGAASVGITINRSSTFFERVRLSCPASRPDGRRTSTAPAVFGWTAKSATAQRDRPAVGRCRNVRVHDHRHEPGPQRIDRGGGHRGARPADRAWRPPRPG